MRAGLAATARAGPSRVARGRGLALAAGTVALLATQQLVAGRFDDARLAGLPGGLAVHLGVCLLAAGWLALLVRGAWPALGGDGEGAP